MRSILQIIVAALLVSSSKAQVHTQAGLSPRTKQVIQEVRGNMPAALSCIARRKHADGIWYASAMIKVADASQAENGIRQLSGIIGTKAGDIWTVYIPEDKLVALTMVSGVSYIELDEPAFPQMQQARQKTRVDSVQDGINLPMRYSGKNVVVGVIDFGFDYNHPTMFDTLGNGYRIRKVWELNSLGTPPTGYTYGHEETDSNAIRARGTDNPEQMHGTAVAGIAAGSGYISSGAKTYRGMAYDADMILVGVRRDTIGNQWMQGTFTDFIDGINYIFTQAAVMGKPAVVNISWGSQSGPHNGSTLFNQACDNLSGPGKIIVMSAGNEGQEQIHLNKNFSAGDTLLRTYLTFTSTAYQRTWIDIWGEPGKSFCANTFLKAGIGGTGNSTGFFCLDNNIHDTWIIGSNGIDSCLVSYIGTTSAFNNQPRLTINVWNKTTDTVGLEISGQNGLVHVWNEYYFYGYKYKYSSAFDSLSDASARSGDTRFTVSDMGSGQRVLLVGAYASKTAWTNISGNSYYYNNYVTVNNLVPFSSRGPLTDGRVKPDIAAPGLTLATATSSYDTAATPTGTRVAYVVNSTAHLGKTYYYAEFIGTSASAPAASGIVALLLQQKPSLTPEELKDLLFQTAIKDATTGPLLTPDNDWGHGKINAYRAMRQLVQQTGVYSFEGEKLDCVLYPNPGNGSFILDLQSKKTEVLFVQVIDLQGRLVQSSPWSVNQGANEFKGDIMHLIDGFYIVKVTGSAGSISINMVKH